MLIYIVEDNEFFAEFVATGLEQKGYEIKKFSNGEAMLEIVDNKIPDILILDYHIESSHAKFFNGGQILEILLSRHKNIPVIMLTALNNVKESISLLKKGAVDYIIKDDDFFENLNKSIDNIVSVKNLNIEIQNQKQRIKLYKKRLALSGLFVVIALVILYLIYF